MRCRLRPLWDKLSHGVNADKLGAASGFALGRNQKVRLIEKLRKVLYIKMLRSVKTKIEHKKQRFERLYYGFLSCIGYCVTNVYRVVMSSPFGFAQGKLRRDIWILTKLAIRSQPDPSTARCFASLRSG